MATFASFGSPYDARTALPAAASPAAKIGAPKPSTGGASPAAQLQNALKALGVTSGDPLLMAIKVDGIVGPATVKGVNHALSNYVGSTPAFPRADMTVAKVRQYAGALASLMATRVAKSGGSVPPPVVQKAAPRRSVSAASFSPIPLDPTPAPEQPKWLWYAVGGGGVLLLLMVAAAAAQRRKAAAA
jgi:hypothetical protein